MRADTDYTRLPLWRLLLPSVWGAARAAVAPSHRRPCVATAAAGLDRAGKTSLLERLKSLYTDVAGLEADKVGAGSRWPAGQQPGHERPVGRATGHHRRSLAHFTAHTRAPTPQVLPTVGLNLAHFEALGSPLLCWDVGGAAGLRGIWSK